LFEWDFQIIKKKIKCRAYKSNNNASYYISFFLTESIDYPGDSVIEQITHYIRRCRSAISFPTVYMNGSDKYTYCF
jgi:hypothetical protein